MVSPSGKFRIHFDTTGANTPAMIDAEGRPIEGTAQVFVDSVARIFDEVWQIEVTQFGFPPPPADGGNGGGDELDIYLLNIGPPECGETDWVGETPLPGSRSAQRFPVYISIDHQFGRGYRTMGIAALKATAAHEFQHAIQIGNYGLRTEGEVVVDHDFYDICAEAMEPTVYPDVKDYIKDVPIYLTDLQSWPLYLSNGYGYERAIWGIFLMKRYGIGVMREIWGAMADMHWMPAMASALAKHGTSLQSEFSEFCLWNYYTGWRADTVKYYPDARLFPTVQVQESQLLATNPLFQWRCRGFTANYVQVRNMGDTATFIIANVDMDDAASANAETKDFTYTLNVSSSSLPSGVQLANGWWRQFSVTNPANWSITSATTGGVLAGSSSPCFPNPFDPGSSSLYIPATGFLGDLTTINIDVFTAAHRLVFSGVVPLREVNGSIYGLWNGRDRNGEPVASGVYLYAVTSGGVMSHGKFAVVRKRQ